jgi:hypothetical protein
VKTGIRGFGLVLLFWTALSVTARNVSEGQQQNFPELTPRPLPGAGSVQEIPRPAQPAPLRSPSTPAPPQGQFRLRPTIPEAGGPGRPPALMAQPGCELWRGTFSGNDPSVLVEASLCIDSSNFVKGVVQWSSLKSGYNVREVSGIRGPNGELSLSDTAFRVSRPRFGWWFCLIDHYALTLWEPDHLVGSYESHACRDYAKVDLILVSRSSNESTTR